jgi:hypothetical protein
VYAYYNNLSTFIVLLPVGFHFMMVFYEVDKEGGADSQKYGET